MKRLMLVFLVLMGCKTGLESSPYFDAGEDTDAQNICRDEAIEIIDDTCEEARNIYISECMEEIESAPWKSEDLRVNKIKERTINCLELKVCQNIVSCLKYEYGYGYCEKMILYKLKCSAEFIECLRQCSKEIISDRTKQCFITIENTNCSDYQRCLNLSDPI